MVLRKDEKQRFKKFTEMLNERNEEPALNLIGFAECETHVAKTFEIDGSVKDEISNLKNIRIFTNRKNFNESHILKVIVELCNDQCDELYNSSTLRYKTLNETEYKELLELLDISKDYIFVFNF